MDLMAHLGTFDIGKERYASNGFTRHAPGTTGAVTVVLYMVLGKIE